MAFYDLPEAERVALTRSAIAERRTVIERWNALGEREASAWSERAARAAVLLADCASVADLGCGTMGLRRYLRPGTRYVPVDVVARDDATVVVDLNRETLPALGVEGWAAIGLLEYLFDVPGLFRQLSGCVVTSYNTIDLCHENRLSHAWVNAYGTEDLEAIFVQAGWTICAQEITGSQRLWKLRR